jgi:hypothetical protein
MIRLTAEALSCPFSSQASKGATPLKVGHLIIRPAGSLSRPGSLSPREQ